MTPGQKAAATRRANRAAGIPPKSKNRGTGSKRGPVFARVDGRALAFEGLAKLEDALGIIAAEKPGVVTPELDAKFQTYQKVKRLALSPGTPGEGAMALSRALRTINELIATIL